MPCTACDVGPKGIDGHPQIALDVPPSRKSHALFRCTACGETYSRTYEGGGMFIWIRASRPPAE
jgi:hypothetical protein